MQCSTVQGRKERGKEEEWEGNGREGVTVSSSKYNWGEYVDRVDHTENCQQNALQHSKLMPPYLSLFQLLICFFYLITKQINDCKVNKKTSILCPDQTPFNYSTLKCQISSFSNLFFSFVLFCFYLFLHQFRFHLAVNYFSNFKIIISVKNFYLLYVQDLSSARIKMWITVFLSLGMK